MARRLAAATCSALALALAGCADDSVQRPAGHHVTIHLSEFHISPATVVLAPGRYTITAVNDGRLAHRFALGRGRAAVGHPPVIAPGGRATLRITLPRGRYRMFCALSNHDVLGMYGRVVVHP
jgi:plastocyanin